MTEVEQTPALIVDRATALRNIERLRDYSQQHGLRVRPHTKTHKSLEFAVEQIKAGAVGLSVAKAGEAEVMSQVTDDVLVAYPAIDGPRVRRLAALAVTKTIRVAIDSPAGVAILDDAATEADSTIGILVDLDVGFHRTGVQSSDEALAIAQAVARSKSLRLDGLFFFPGHLRDSVEPQISKLRQVDAIVLDAIDALERSGLHVSIVSGGSTPSLYQLHHLKAITEIRPGTYVFNDMSTVAGGYCKIEDCAARVTATVISTAVPGKCVVDAGTKTLAADRNSVRPESGFGYVVEYPDAKIVRLTEEHGEIDITGCDHSPKTGDRLTLIPNHICPCVNLQAIAWTRNLDGSLQPLRIDARGLIS